MNWKSMLNERRGALRPWTGTRVLAFLTILVLAGGVSAGDGKGRKKIVCTFLPVYVFTLNVVNDAPDVDVEMLVSADVGCPHHYTARPADLKAAGEANVIVANGLDMEPFLPELLKNSPNVKVIAISDDCDVIRVEGEHHHGPGEKCDHDHGAVNGHVWASPLQAVRQVRLLARRLGEADPERAALYAIHAEAYAGRLEGLHERMREAARGFVNRRIVTTHDSFAYLARDLGLEVVATIESEPGRAPSAHRMAKVIETIRETKAGAVFYEPSGSDRVARTVAADAGVPVYSLNPFTSLSGRPTARSYEDVMEQNLTTLKNALGSGP